MKKVIILLKSGFILKAANLPTFNESGKMNKQNVSIYSSEGTYLGDSDDFYLKASEISGSFWIEKAQENVPQEFTDDINKWIEQNL